MAYSHDGQGLHRSTDPADGEALRLRPPLPRRRPDGVRLLRPARPQGALHASPVTAPAEWTVLGNGGATLVAPGPHRAGDDPAAGDLLRHGLRRALRVRARRARRHPAGRARAARRSSRTCASRPSTCSRPPGPASTTTTGCSASGTRSASTTRCSCPEFNAGAMENPGCVTFRDTMIFRGAATPDQVLSAQQHHRPRDGAHVVRRPGDDALVGRPVAQRVVRRVHGLPHGRSRSPSSPTPGSSSASSASCGGMPRSALPAPTRSPGRRPPTPCRRSGNFDGISYAKGASVIRQLIAHIGDDAFVAGVVEHLRSHAFGNGDLAQFLAAMESASGRSLAAWSAAWLETAGADRLAVEEGVLTRTPPAGHPADRPHTLDVAAFAGGREVARVDVVVAGGAHPRARPRMPCRRARSSFRTPVTSPGRRCRSTPRRWRRCRPGWPTCPTPRPAPCSGSRCWARSTAPRSTPASALEVFAQRLAARDVGGGALARPRWPSTSRVVPMFLPPTEQEAALARVAGRGRRPARAGSPGRGRRRATRSRSSPRGCGPPAAPTPTGCGAGRAGTASRPCSTVTTTSAGRCCAGSSSLDALGGRTRSTQAAAADRSLAGSLAALGVRAVRPTGAAKAWAWAALRDDAELSNYAALVGGRRVLGGARTPSWSGPTSSRWVTCVVSALGADGRRRASRGWSPPSTHPAGRRRDRARRRPPCWSATTSPPGCGARSWTPTTSCARRWPAGAGSTGRGRERP